MQHVVILNDWESIKDAFHKDSFLGRPEVTPSFALSGTRGFPDVNGDVWREQRRFTLSLLRDLGFGKGGMEERIKDEIGYLIKEIDKSNGGPIQIKSLLSPSMSNNICSLVFGHRLDYLEPNRVLLDKAIETMSKLIHPFAPLGGMYPLYLTKLFASVSFLTAAKSFIPVFSFMK